MLVALWQQLVMKRMARAAARGGRPVLCVEGLEDRVTPAGIFAVASSAGAPASVSVFDAATRAPKFTIAPFPGFTGGLNVATGDVNGDGTADVVVAPAAGGGPVVNVYSGTDGTLLKTIAAGDDGSRAGAGVAAADFDADGLADVVVGAIRNGQPLVQEYRFADLAVLHGYTPFSGAGGVSVAAADPTGTAPIAFTVVFSEVATGFDETGLDVTNGTASNVATTDGLTYTFDVTPTGDGPVGVTVNAGAAADAAGNGNVASDTVTVVFDGTATAAAADPLTTNSTTPTLTGTVDDSSATVTVVVDGQTSTATVSGTSWSADVPADLDEGTYDIVVTATDTLGNSGTTTLAGGLVIDLTAPTVTISAPSVALTAGGPVTFTVTYADATPPTVTLSDADVSLVTTDTAAGTVSVSGSGLVWTVTVSGVTGDGTIAITIAPGTATDAAGNTSDAAGPSGTFEADNAAPAAPVVTGLDPATDAGAFDYDGVTNNPSPTFAGTAEPGGTVEVFADAGSGPASLGTTTADATTGAWSLTPTDPLADGAYSVTAVATDAAGNVGNPSAAFSLVIDTADPSATVDAVSVGGISGTATDTDGSGVVRVQVSVREPGDGGLYYDGEAFTSADPLFFDATDDSAGGDFSAWSYALPPGTSGGYTVTARVTDLAGNEADGPATPVLVS